MQSNNKKPKLATAKKPKLIRQAPPTFPMGFKTMSSDDTCIIDFLHFDDSDDGDDVLTIFYTMALTKKTAENLVNALQGFINRVEHE